MKEAHTKILAALRSGRFNPDQIAFMEPQTGGACCAGNIYNAIIKSLKKAGYDQIPVISLNAFGKEKHEGLFVLLRGFRCKREISGVLGLL